MTVQFPSSLHEQDVITELVEKRQGAYPHPDRFPSPFVHKATGRVQDARQGEVTLEAIWQPLWDTQPLNRAEVVFFHSPGGRGTALTNLETSGALAWPRRFYLWELVFQFGPTGAARFVPDYMKTPERVIAPLAEKIVAVIRIGDKIQYRTPLSIMYRQHPCTFRAALCAPLHIPSVQSFWVSLDFGRKHHFPSPQTARCILNGYLLREIQ